MRVIGTKCPHCGKLQLAIGEQLGVNVKCAHCARMFICLDETGDLPFVKPTNNEDGSVGFEKQITRAFDAGVKTCKGDVEFLEALLK